MRAENMLHAMDMIDDEVIQEAKSGGKRRGKGWVRWCAAAACLGVIAAGAYMWGQSADAPEEGKSGVIVSEEGVTISPAKVSLAADEKADMLAFFIYQGRCYVQYETVDGDADNIGEHLGTATGMIDEWTEKDGYVELAGSVKGDFYAVKGYDPSFMLCMRLDNGDIWTYICGTGITLKYGSELYEDRLRLTGNYTAVRFESRASWDYSLDEIYELNDADAAVDNFIKALNAAAFMPTEDIPLAEGQSSVYETEIYHLYFLMENGMTVHLRLFEGGYVSFAALSNVCVQIPEESYDALLELLEGDDGKTAVDVDRGNDVTFEDCVSAPELGGFVPGHVPEGFTLKRAEIRYYLDPDTGGKTGTRDIILEYSDGAEAEYAVTVAWAAAYGQNGWAGPMLDRAELSVDALSEYVETENSRGEPLSYGSRIDVGVWFGDVSVVFSGRGVDAGTAFAVLSSAAE